VKVRYDKSCIAGCDDKSCHGRSLTITRRFIDFAAKPSLTALPKHTCALQRYPQRVCGRWRAKLKRLTPVVHPGFEKVLTEIAHIIDY